MERVKTGIPGFDNLIQGGIPKGANVLLTGLPGTGKTIFGLQYLCEGALAGEKGLYVSLDAKESEIIDQGALFGWDIEDLRKKNMLLFSEIPLNRKSRISLFRLIEDVVKQEGIKRLVLDSLSSLIFNLNQFLLDLPVIDDLSMMAEDKKKYLHEDPLQAQYSSSIGTGDYYPDPKYYEAPARQRVVYLMLRELSHVGTTNMIITGQDPGRNGTTVDGVSEFASDGVVKFEMTSIGKVVDRTLEVSKMRKTKIDGAKHNFDFGEGGIKIE